ncbi:aminopeptidase P family protein [Peptostreptococcaceae bacterium AGR-M142]
MIQNRVDSLLSTMKENDIPQILITDPSSIFYFTGEWIHPGERMLALYISLENENKIFINELFPVTADLGVEKIWFKDTDDSVKLLSNYIDNDKKIGIDKNWPSKFLLKMMDYNIASSYVNGSDLVDYIRQKKDNKEKELMRNASKLNDDAISMLINNISDAKNEQDMAVELTSIYKNLNTSGHSFDPIIAFGKNGADPHHETDNSTLKPGDSIIVDIGCIKDSYCSDMTRTVFYKEASSKAKEVYNTVLEANKKAIEKVKPGAKFSEIDLAARNYIESKGYGKYFTHRTGHSIGIDVHETGDVSSVNHEILEPGMIFSVEPGIYIPNEFGVRIEDLVLVTEDGCEVLNSYPKDLKIIN